MLGQQQEPPLETTSQRKKKCRGNRREQHLRRRVRRKNLQETAETLLTPPRIENDAQTIDNRDMEANHGDDDIIHIDDEQGQVYSDCRKQKYFIDASMIPYSD